MSLHTILFLAPSMQAMGGVTEFCRMLVANLGPDFQVDLLTVANRPGVQNPLRRVGHFCGDYFRLRKKLKNSRYSLCHLNPSFRILALLRDGLYIRLIHRFYPGRILITFHGWDSRLFARITQNTFLRGLLKKTVAKARRILVLSEKFKSQLESIGCPPEKITVITTMYEGHFADRKKADALGKEKINVVFVSRFIRCKGAHIAAETIRLLVEQGHKNISAVFAGNGPEWRGVRDYIRISDLDAHIQLPGFVKGEEKRKMMEQGDIFLFPTFCQEGCPIVLLEAMGAGMAVVSTPAGAIPEIVEQNKNGFLVDSQNPDDFASKIAELLGDNEKIQKIKYQNQEEAESKYRAQIVTKKIEFLYRELLEEAASPLRD